MVLEIFGLLMRSLCAASTRLEQGNLVLLLVDVLAIVRDLTECELTEERWQTRAIFVSKRTLRLLGIFCDYDACFGSRIYFHFVRHLFVIFVLLIIDIFYYASTSHSQFFNFMLLWGLN